MRYDLRPGGRTLALLRGAATTVAGIVNRRGERIRRVGQDCATTITGSRTADVPADDPVPAAVAADSGVAPEAVPQKR